MGKFIDLVSKKFGRLTVMSESKIVQGIHFWNCICSCGKQTVVEGSNLRKGITKSCGCLRIELLVNRSYKHKMANTRFYHIWKGLYNRTHNPNNYSYKHYGGRGIRCLWSSFEQFKKDMFNSYIKHCSQFGEKNTSIDRIDNEGNYCSKNCKWSTTKEQALNKRKRVNFNRDNLGRFIKF